jgi:hypothetical protein
MTAMTAIAPHLHILLAPWRQRLNQGSLWVWAVIAGLAYLVPAITYFTDGTAKGLVIATVLLLMAVLLAAWGSTVESLHSQNSPSTARLVPGHVGRLRQSLLAAWTVIGLLAATIIGLAFGHGWFFGVMALALMLAIERTMCRLYRAAAVILVFVVSVPYVKGTELGEWVMDTVVHLYNAQPVLPLLAIALVLTLVMARFGVGRGDARHRHSFERAQSWRAQMQAVQAGKTPVHFQGRIAWRITWLTWAPYRWWMQRLLRQPQTSTRHVMAKMLLGFGPDLHWITQVFFVTLIVLAASAISVTVAVATVPGTAKDAMADALGGLVFGMVSAPVLILFTQRKMLHQSQREQALLLLLPGMPRGAALNRALAAQWLWRFWLTWLLAGAALRVAMLFFNDSMAGMGFLIPSMTACLILVCDWSTVRFADNKPLALGVVAYVVAGAACTWMLFYFELSPWPFMAFVLLLTLLALRWKWSRLDGYQQALPAGRWG